MSKRTPHYRQMQERAKQIGWHIQAMLDWDSERYKKFQIKCGCAYLQHYIPRDPEGIDMLVKESMFWNWWKNRWMDRDEVFLLIKFDVGDDIISDYNRMHSPVELAKEIHPTAISLGNSYANMIGKLQDLKTK